MAFGNFKEKHLLQAEPRPAVDGSAVLLKCNALYGLTHKWNTLHASKGEDCNIKPNAVNFLVHYLLITINFRRLGLTMVPRQKIWRSAHL